MSSNSTVLALPQLREMIMLAPDSLTIRDLMHCRHVCTSWRDTIDGSLRIRKRMHLAPVARLSDPLSICDTLPHFMTAARLATCHTEGRDRECLAVVLDSEALQNAKIECLNEILFVQPPRRIRTTALNRCNVKDGGPQWTYHNIVKSDAAVTLGAVAGGVRRTLRDSTSYSDCSFPEHGEVILVALLEPMTNTQPGTTEHIVPPIDLREMQRIERLCKPV